MKSVRTGFKRYFNTTNANSEIIKGNRRITADTALRLSMYFGNSPKFWLGIQDDYDIEEGEIQKKAELNSIKQIQIHAA